MFRLLAHLQRAARGRGGGSSLLHHRPALLESTDILGELENAQPHQRVAIGQRYRDIGNITDLNSKNFSLIKEDILNYDSLTKSMKDIEIVFHLAAQPGIRFSLENPTVTNKINTEGTLNILRACKENNVKKLVNASSSSVYGNPNYIPVDEQHPIQPISIYGVSKAAAERYCYIYSHIHNQNLVSLRFHTAYGPRGRPDMAVFKWIDSLFQNKTITLYGDGTQTRDMTYVDDIVDGTIKAAEADTTSGDVFNLASGERVSMNFILELLTKLTGKQPKIEHKDVRKDDAKDTHGNIEKAKKILNYVPKTLIEDGLKNTIAWYKERFNI